MPYAHYGYLSISTPNRYINPLINNSNGFDKLEKLCFDTKTIGDNSSYYFRNVQSLIMSGGRHNKIDQSKLQRTKIEFLNTIVNLSNIKYLRVPDDCFITSTLLLKIFKKRPNLSTLEIDKMTLISFLKSRQLCKSLNGNIITLDVTGEGNDKYIQSNEIYLICQTFSNLEQPQCHINFLGNLVFILTKCSKLTTIKLGGITQEIYSWIQINASTLNYFTVKINIDKICFIL
jgi:hypothetical protein